MNSVFAGHHPKQSSGSDTTNNSTWKKALMAEITQLKRQMEAQQLLNKPGSERLITRYQRMIESRERLYTSL